MVVGSGGMRGVPAHKTQNMGRIDPALLENSAMMFTYNPYVNHPDLYMCQEICWRAADEPKTPTAKSRVLLANEC